MEEIQYIGEHLLPGKIGKFFIILALVSAIISSYSYFVATQKRNTGNLEWIRIGRISFLSHVLGIFGIIITLFYMLLNGMFEYFYVWEHSSSILPLRYILSCFWEGQEGSFLLWAFWHAILALILMKSAKEWEAPVLAVIAVVQVFLISMLLGIYFGDYRLGSNPFLLLREHHEYMKMPFVKFADYLSKIDGRGLNPLLQNYWMTIHPPTLFLGFAATLVPFAYAIAALWTKQYKKWLTPVLPWTIFGVMILGIGILMGGAWAYEALSFGGFWAWDPVENASLVPWLTFIAALHMMHVANNKNKGFGFTFIFTLITFILVLYSTFLTRSGVLGESSVHAFTDLGIGTHLLIYLAFFTILSIILIVIRWNDFSKQKTEDELWSKEFWLFLSSLLLGISALIISFSTSYPVINKLFGSEFVIIDAAEHYHKTQIPIAILILILLGFGQYLKYNSTEIKPFIKNISISFIVSLLLSVIISYYLKYDLLIYSIMLFAGLFGVLANLDYWLRIKKRKTEKNGASIAHIGIALILLGALISTSKSVVVSPNTSSIDLQSLSEDFKNTENIFLQKGDTLKMNDYYIVYSSKKKEGVNVFFNVEYFKKEDNKLVKQFTLSPIIQTNEKMGNVAEPATKHYFNKDIYTHIIYANLDDNEHDGHDHANEDEHAHENDYDNSVDHSVHIGDTIFTNNSIIVLEELTKNVDKAKYGIAENNVAVGAKLKIQTLIQGITKTYYAEPIYVITEKAVTPIIDQVKDLGMVLAFWKIEPETNTIHISVTEKKSDSKDFIIMKAIIFPWINILWIGCIVMMIGSLIAIWEKFKVKAKE